MIDTIGMSDRRRVSDMIWMTSDRGRVGEMSDLMSDTGRVVSNTSAPSTSGGTNTVSSRFRKWRKFLTWC